MRGAGNAFLFGCGNGCQRPAERLGSARFNFRKHECFPVLHNEVDFAALYAKITRQKFVALLLQIAQGFIFPFPPDSGRITVNQTSPLAAARAIICVPAQMFCGAPHTARTF